MKKLSIISLITAALAFGFASCADKAEEFKKGAPDSANCYGVYFPAQETELSLDPAEPTVDTIIVARTKTEGAITVPYTLIDDSKVFAASELKFEDGQTESYIAISFDSAQVGTQYVCSIVIDDPEYASQYSSNAIAIDIKVTRDKWVDLGLATFTENFFGVEYKLPLLMNEKNPNLFRLMHPFDTIVSDLLPDPEDGMPGGPNGKMAEYLSYKLLQPGDELGSTDPLTIEGEDLVYFGITQIGWGYDDGTYKGDLIYVHPFNLGYEEEDFGYSKVLQYQEDGLPAGIQLAPYYFINGAGVGWNNMSDDGVIVITYPGAVLTDYSLELEADFACEGVQDVTFTLGIDVAWAEFATYEGALNASQISSKLESILAGEDSTVLTVDSTSIVSLSFPATGEYTLIAVAYDADTVAQSYESIVLNYVAAGDSKEVDIDAELISTKKYEKMGYSSDNCLEFSIYGSDLKEVYLGFFTSKSFNSDPMACYELINKNEKYAVDAETLEMINDLGYTDVVTELNSGTSYTLFVIANNGFEEDYVILEATTTGNPAPMEMFFSTDDFDEDLKPATAEGYNGSYDFFAVPGYDSETGEREYISTVTIEAANDSMVTIKNLFEPVAKKYNFDDSMDFVFYNGYLFSLANVFFPSDSTGVYAAPLYPTSDGKLYNFGNDNVLVGCFVCEGHIAIVDNTGGQYKFAGWRLRSYSDETFSKAVANLGPEFLFPLLATAGLYDAENAPARGMSTLNKISAALNAPRTNYVETEDGYIKSIIRNASKHSTCGTVAGLGLTSEPRSVASKIVAVKAVEISEPTLERDSRSIRY